jgi:hypothetical protein
MAQQAGKGNGPASGGQRVFDDRKVARVVDKGHVKARVGIGPIRFATKPDLGGTKQSPDLARLQPFGRRSQ